MSGLKILISGGGIAGPAAGFFLSKAGADVTIVERAQNLRTSGQNVDIRGAAREVVRIMGLEDVMKQHHTTEQGMMWVDDKNKCVAPFPASSGSGESFTAELEILRTDLAQIMYDATKDNTKWVFGDHITNIEELGDRAHVTMAQGEIKDYDIVIAADGLSSATRSLAIPEFGEQWINRTGMYMAFFSMPRGETDSDWCRWYTAPGRRSVMARPDNNGNARVVLCIMNGDPRLEEVLSRSQKEQKALMRELFQDAGWELNRLLKGMDATEDFYMDKIAQTKMPFWSRGRVVLLGDAAYGPSPITGMGTSLAFVGAYVLAGEIIKHSKDVHLAFSEYDTRLRPFIKEAQKIFPGAPGLIHPQSAWGVTIMYFILSIISHPIVQKVFTKFSGPPADKFQLPKYDVVA